MLAAPIYVRHSESGQVGVIVSEHLTPEVVEENGQQVVRQKPIVGVCWEEQRSPAIDYCSPFDLEWIAIDGVTAGEDDEDEEDEDEDVEEVEEVSASPQA